ncbi:MAG: TetR/AcrR family transcriptional regulator [Acidobacteriota bacterium]
MPRTKSERTKTAILGAATRAFESREFHEVLTDDIAAGAGIGKATLYRYFGTKEDLYFATILQGFDELHAALERPTRSGSARERLSRVAVEIVRIFGKRPSFYRLLHESELHLRERERLLLRHRARTLRMIKGIIDEGIVAGELRPIDSRLRAEFFLGIVRAALLYRRETDTPEYLREEILAAFFDGASA